MSGSFKTRLNRRAFLRSSAGTLAGAALPSILYGLPLQAGSRSVAKLQAPPRLHPGGLAEIASRKGLLFGASFAVHELDRPHGDQYAEIYRHDAAVLTSELGLKLAILRPAAHRLDFDSADRLVAFARANSKQVRGHTLIWDDGLPAWVHDLGPGETEHLLFAHIVSVMERFRGAIPVWDVVNEPIAPWDKNPGNLRQGPFYSALGEDYIGRSFRLARKTDPEAQLFLNEAQTESDDENGAVFRESFLALVRRLLDQGVPIDGVGLQSHLQSERPYDFAKFAGFLQELADLGLKVHITELDVNDKAFAEDVRDRDRLVAQMYREFLSAVLQVKKVEAVILWQLSDATSWMADPNFTDLAWGKRKPRPLPYDGNFQKKPAWSAIAAALEDMPSR